MTATAPLIATDNLGRSFSGVSALSGVNFAAFAGEVHALMGANGAGKSTLIKIISGALQPSQGRVLVDGRPVAFATPAAAQRAGIGTVYQEFALVPHLTVAENLFLGREPLRAGLWIDHRRRREMARELLERLGFALDADAVVGSLRVAHQQLVEIARALSLNARILILDEPTAVLSVPEQEQLFGIVRRLRETGMAVLYISHRMEEIFQLADRVSVFRDGQLRSSAPLSAITEVELIRQMVGDVTMAVARSAATQHAGRRERLRVRYVWGGRVSHLQVRAGEIVGVAGFVGAGRTRLARGIASQSGDSTQQVTLDGRALVQRGFGAAAREGIVYITEDRKRDGLFGPLRVRPNVSAASLPRVSSGGLLRFSRERALAGPPLARMRLKAASEAIAVHALSGGNQQKVLFARGLVQTPKVLICDEPTRGVDVGAKQEIYALLRALSAEGVAVLVISSEFSELRTLCDRIVVMYQGSLVAEFAAHEASEERLLSAASGLAVSVQTSITARIGPD